jgi:hypothetical protein
MKIAVVSEGPHDEAAVKILVDAVLGMETKLVAVRRSPEGWPSVLNLLPAIITDLHYQQVDTQGLVVVVDSDDSPLHDASHTTSEAETVSCRLCQLRGVAEGLRRRLTPVPNRTPLKIAFGLAVPQIEAWYRCGLDPHVNENTWGRKIRGELGITYNGNSLKNDVYGSDRVPSFVKTEIAKQAAQRLATNLEQLEQLFPNGFGAFVTALRDW